MKNFIDLLLIGLLIRYGSADVSHLTKHVHNEYLPPQPANNLFIDQDYNGINSHQPDKETRGYLPPYHQHSQDHQYPQQEQVGYLPPPIKTQEHSHKNILNQQLDTNLGYLPPSPGQSHGQEHPNNYNLQKDRGYLPPYQEHFENRHQHHNTLQYNQASVDPNLQVSNYNNYAISQSKGSDSNKEYEDNSQGYNYSPPNYGFEEGHQQHHQDYQENNFISEQQSPANVVQAIENQKINQDAVQPHQEAPLEYHQSNEESNTQSNQKQNLDYVPPNDTNLINQNVNIHQQVTRDYLPPSPSSQEHTKTYQNQPAQEDNLSPSNFKIESTQESHGADERDVVPPISALELPQSSDTLHIVPPSKLGLPIQQSKTQLETNHIDVPLPIPHVGYYFIPGIVTRLPSLREIQTEHLSSVSNIPSNEGQTQRQQQQNQQQHVQQQLPISNISPNDYSRPSISGLRIIPSVQTAREIAIHGHLTPNQVVGHHQHFADIGVSSPDSNVHKHNFPPLVQPQHQNQLLNQQLEQNQNEVENVQQQDDQSQSHIENFANSPTHSVSNQQNQSDRPLEPSNENHQENAYLPPIDDYHQQQTYQNQNQQTVAEIQNQVTNIQTYMDNVSPDDRYGSLQFQPQQATESNPPPASPPLMYSKPSAVKAYAPGMAYKVSTNVPFNSFTQAGYLPPVGTSKSEQNRQEYSSSIGFELNEQAKKDLNQQTGHDNTIFPIADILSQDDETSQIMEQLQGHIRTIQITNHQDDSVKNIKVLDSSNQAGVRTIEILGQSNENPIGDHKVLHVISKAPNPQTIHQTIKIFNDSKEVALPTNNEYLPPPKIDGETELHRFRRYY